MKIRIQLSAWGHAGARGQAPRPVPGRWALLGSLAGHALAWPLLMAVWAAGIAVEDRPVDWSAYRVEPVRLRLFEPLRLGAAPGAGPARGGGSGQRDGPARRGARRARRVWQPPPLPALPPGDPILKDVQPASAAFAPLPELPLPDGSPGGGAVAGPLEAAGGDGEPPAEAPPVQVEHAPQGVYDVVIAESARGESAAAYLSGDPVYRVYLPVGAEREWILQFCAPAAPSPGSAAYQVQAADSGPLTPPYPLTTVIPGMLVHGPGARELVLHALLSADGSLLRVAALDPGDLMARDIARLLAEWRFRPALRDGRPLEVELLLTVPRARPGR